MRDLRSEPRRDFFPRPAKRGEGGERRRREPGEGHPMRGPQRPAQTAITCCDSGIRTSWGTRRAFSRRSLRSCRAERFEFDAGLPLTRPSLRSGHPLPATRGEGIPHARRHCSL